MAVPQLTKPIVLSLGKIQLSINNKSPGAYLLGAIAQNQKLTPYYTGRADVDIADRLGAHVGKYDAFMFALAPSAMNAFFMECELFHTYAPRDNKIHPAKPQGAAWKCPVCGQ
jgi:hypothetical protein